MSSNISFDFFIAGLYVLFFNLELLHNGHLIGILIFSNLVFILSMLKCASLRWHKLSFSDEFKFIILISLFDELNM